MNTLSQHPICDDFKKHNLLALHSYHLTDLFSPRIVKFHGSDSEEAFNKNLKKMPHDWNYRFKEIEYHINSYGYRTEEFDQLNWKDSIVLFGCSNIFGIGVAEDENLTHFIKIKTGRPIINLGAPGSSILFSYFNALSVEQRYPTPAAVVNAWTSYDRITMFERTVAQHYGNWKNSINHKLWNQTETNPLMYALMIQLSSRVLWERKTKYFEFSFFKHTAIELNCPHFQFHMTARDLAHPGPQCLERAADQIITELKL